jgi:pimeloyl-ACP methyl ester carboxylesterase
MFSSLRSPAGAHFCLLGLLLLVQFPALTQAREAPFQLESFDGYHLNAKFELPAKPQPVKRLAILIHGSGPQTMDEDLTAATRNHRSNFFFRDISRALVTTGFTTLRYHKRSYQIQLSLKEDPSFASSPILENTRLHPLGSFLGDVKAAIQVAHQHFPRAKIYLLGHSQGCYLALQAAAQSEEVAGVGLIGFHLAALDTLVYAQTVYRPLVTFDRLDRNRDGNLSPAELSSDTPLQTSLRAQLPLLDLDRDGSISRTEFQAGNLSNLVIRDLLDPRYRAEEAALPRVAKLLKDYTKPVFFFQGEWDNQCPVHNAKAVQIAVQTSWKHLPGKTNWRFHFFPGLGHALDPRESYEDLLFQPIDPGALQTLAREMRASFP